MSHFAALGRARYVSLETYRAGGLPVRTPVWITAEANKLYCWTISDTGKVKRIGNNSRVRLAICTARGHIWGDWADAEARILETSAALRQQLRRLRAKYGLLFLPFAWWPRITRTATSVIEITEADETS